MLRHLSTGSETLAALMAATRRGPPPTGGVDIRRLLAELGEHATAATLPPRRRPEFPTAAE
ncbi:MAG: hypothetical protein INR65_07535 [Gluconacetobacter diazotrophicus]|nr:hypothetical protein [Gluconacetobacter diazotrophicus]